MLLSDFNKAIEDITITITAVSVAEPHYRVVVWSLGNDRDEVKYLDEITYITSDQMYRIVKILTFLKNYTPSVSDMLSLDEIMEDVLNKEDMSLVSRFIPYDDQFDCCYWAVTDFDITYVDESGQTFEITAE